MPSDILSIVKDHYGHNKLQKVIQELDHIRTEKNGNKSEVKFYRPKSKTENLEKK